MIIICCYDVCICCSLSFKYIYFLFFFPFRALFLLCSTVGYDEQFANESSASSSNNSCLRSLLASAQARHVRQASGGSLTLSVALALRCVRLAASLPRLLVRSRNLALHIVFVFVLFCVQLRTFTPTLASTSTRAANNRRRWRCCRCYCCCCCGCIQWGRFSCKQFLEHLHGADFYVASAATCLISVV